MGEQCGADIAVPTTFLDNHAAGKSLEAMIAGSNGGGDNNNNNTNTNTGSFTELTASIICEHVERVIPARIARTLQSDLSKIMVVGNDSPHRVDESGNRVEVAASEYDWTASELAYITGESDDIPMCTQACADEFFVFFDKVKFEGESEGQLQKAYDMARSNVLQFANTNVQGGVLLFPSCKQWADPRDIENVGYGTSCCVSRWVETNHQVCEFTSEMKDAGVNGSPPTVQAGDGTCVGPAAEHVIRKAESVLRRQNTVVDFFRVDGLNCFPDSVVLYSGVEHFRIYHNPLLQTMPATLVLPRSLKSLSLDNSGFIGLPGSWVLSDTLNKIDLSNNALKSLPGSWVLPDGLQILNLNNNDLTYIPVSWVLPDGLQEIRLSHNALITLPESWASFPSRVSTDLDLKYNNINFVGSAKVFNRIFASSDWKTLDFSNNKIVSVDGIIWPLSLQVLDLSENELRTIPPLWPASLQQLRMDGNTWEDVVAAAAELLSYIEDTNSTIVPTKVFEELRVSCTANVSIRHSYWTCAQATTQLERLDELEGSGSGDGTEKAAVAGDNATLESPVDTPKTMDDELCSVDCTFTEAGKKVVTSYTSVGDLLVANNEKKRKLKLVGVPIIIIATYVVRWGAQPVNWWEKLDVFVFGWSAVDLMTDWIFFGEFSGNVALEERYTCNQSDDLPPDQKCTLDSGESSFACANNDFGLLKHPCGNTAKASNLEAANECECMGYSCDPGQSSDAFASVPTADIKTCANLFASDGLGGPENKHFTDGMIKCDNFKDLNAFVEEECGMRNQDDPSATGTNECECNYGACQNVPGTGSLCLNDDPNHNYQRLVQTFRIFNIIATLLWLVQSAAYARQKIKWTKTSNPSTLQAMATIRLYIPIAVLFLENIPGLVFTSIYSKYMFNNNVPGDAEVARAKKWVAFTLATSIGSIIYVVMKYGWKIRKICMASGASDTSLPDTSKKPDEPAPAEEMADQYLTIGNAGGAVDAGGAPVKTTPPVTNANQTAQFAVGDTVKGNGRSPKASKAPPPGGVKVQPRNSKKAPTKSKKGSKSKPTEESVSISIRSPLGLTFELGNVITHVKPGGNADATGKVSQGMRIVSVNGSPVEGLTKKEVATKIKASSSDCVLELSAGQEVGVTFIDFESTQPEPGPPKHQGQQEQPEVNTPPAGGFSKFAVGDNVSVNGYDCEGTVRFVGKHAIDGHPRIGIELDQPVGKHSGKSKGTVYFKCPRKCGILVAPTKVAKSIKGGFGFSMEAGLAAMGTGLGGFDESSPMFDASPSPEPTPEPVQHQEDLLATAATISELLDAVEPGYGAMYAEILESMGFDDVADLQDDDMVDEQLFEEMVEGGVDEEAVEKIKIAIGFLNK